MKLSLKEFKDLCSELGFGLTLPAADQEALYQALARKLDWNRGNGADGVIVAYLGAWEARYGEKPIIDGKDTGIAKRLFELLGADEAIRLVEAYLRMSDVFYMQRRHDLGTLSTNLNAVKLFAAGKGSITRAELAQVDRRQANVNAFGKLLGRKS